MIELYYWPTPNGHKISIALEEMGLPYEVKSVNIGAGDQFKPEFLAFSPNNRMPALVDNAPEDIVQRERDGLEKLNEQLQKIEDSLAKLPA